MSISWITVNCCVQEVGETIMAQAALAEEQIESERRKLAIDSCDKKKTNGDQLNGLPYYEYSLLPWETLCEEKSILSEELRAEILKLSAFDEIFTTPLSTSSGSNVTKDSAVMVLLSQRFDLARFVPIAMRLLSLDAQLSASHAKSSPHVREEELWRRYYLRTIYLR